VDAGAEDAGPVDAGPPECRTTDFPDPVSGACAAVIADEGATLPVGDDGEGGYIVPGARRVTRLGTQVELPGFPLTVRRVPGTDYAIVSDGGVDDEQLSVIDLGTGEVVDLRPFREAPDSALFLGVAAKSDGSEIFVSGGGSGYVWRYGFDPATGQLTDGAHVPLATVLDEGYVSDLHLLGDDRTLVVTLMFGAQLVLYDVEEDAEIARVALPEGGRAYDLEVAADDRTAFVSLWDDGVVVPVDLEARTAGTPIPVGKNPEGMALSPDGATLVVANSDSDSLSILDVALGAVVDEIFVVGESAPRGSSPVTGVFSPDGARFLVVNAGDNAVDVLETESWDRVGRIPTMWYPTDVRALDDGRVLILNGKHEGTGANLNPEEDDIVELVGGSLSIVPAAEITDENLGRWEMEIAANNDRATRFLEVECPAGAEYDFPIPAEGAGPSEQIRHVVLVVRENKTYDAYFGDLTDAEGEPLGNGDPELTLLARDEIEAIIPNTRELARQFAMGDNYYSLAEQSVQGHIWTTMGRTTDFVERSWLTTWGRGYWGIPPQGVSAPYGYPEEGSVFDYMAENEIAQTNYGEIVSSRSAPPDGRYPGLIYNLGVEDEVKARYLETQWQSRCRLESFTYVLIPNDHTSGRQPGAPTPRSMIADNDYAVGIIADALSHSRFWPHTAIFVIEDDPQNGGDHVDNHRAPLQVISPWAKRGYVSSVHYNEASIFRTIQLILGLERPLNAYWANASPMLDLFTSTPDYTPYEVIERRWPKTTNPDDDSPMAEESLDWDFSRPDAQPGLSRLLWRHLRGTEPPWPVTLEGEEDDD
ncbi:MAG TPA: alkaline phosphatase family protein, partial [Polyangiaceae bacterium LLY-WYZ-15_(1-7)]|nr:alkaline phosphatase family protein [Polyangiaceae bacterium LLY-WYZ-15_(1-7)]